MLSQLSLVIIEPITHVIYNYSKRTKSQVLLYFLSLRKIYAKFETTYISSCSRITPLFVMCLEPAGFSEMHGGVSAPSCCALIHRVAFEEVSGHRVLLKCGPGNWGLSACCTTH